MESIRQFPHGLLICQLRPEKVAFDSKQYIILVGPRLRIVRSTHSINRNLDSYGQFILYIHIFYYISNFSLFPIFQLQSNIFLIIICSWLVMEYAGYLLGTAEKRARFGFYFLYAMIIICYRFSFQVMVLRRGNVHLGLLSFEFPSV